MELTRGELSGNSTDFDGQIPLGLLVAFFQLGERLSFADKTT